MVTPSGADGGDEEDYPPPPELPGVTSRANSVIGEIKKDGKISRHVSTTKTIKSITFEQKILVLLMCIQAFATFVTIALISPFYPDMAMKKGASVTQVNLVFSLLFLIIFATSPIYGRYITTIGPKFLYLTGMYVRIFSDICFGVLDRMPDGTIFITMSFVIRIFSAFGGSAFSTASYAIVAKEFPDKVSVMFGLLQTMNACGLMMGPPIGGILYDLGAGTVIGSYTFPFLVSGIFGIVITTINTFYLPSTWNTEIDKSKAEGSTKRKGLFVLLRNPRIFVNMSGVAMSYMPLLNTEISLEPHLDKFELSATAVGFMFTSMTAVYALFSSLWGWIDNHWFYPKAQTILGATVYAVACFLIGPSPLFGFDAQLWLIGISLSLIGFSAAAMNTASFKASFIEAISMGMPNDFHTTGIISGLFVGFFTFGAFIGPTLGGIITEAYGEEGYAWSMTIYGFAQIAYVLILVLVNVVFTRKPKQKSEDAENVPLLLSRSNSMEK